MSGFPPVVPAAGDGLTGTAGSPPKVVVGPVRMLPEVLVNCYPRSMIPRRTIDPYSFMDILGDRVNSSGGSGMGPQADTPSLTATQWQEYSDQQTIRQWVERVNVDFCRFHADGTFEDGAGTAKKGDVSGYVLRCVEALQDCKVGTSPPNTSAPGLAFTAVLGKWISIIGPDHPSAVVMLNNGSDLLGIVQTTNPFKANLSHYVDVHFRGHASSTVQPGFRHTWGSNQYSVVLRHKQKPTVERMVSGSWVVWGTLDKEPVCDLQRGHYRIRVRRINGRLVVSIGGGHYWFQDTFKGTADKAPQPIDVTWAAAPLNIHCYNVRALISVAGIQYLDGTNQPAVGHFTRSLSHSRGIASDAVFKTVVGGWIGGDNAGLTPTLATITTDASDQRNLKYTCTMTASGTTGDGVDTPFVGKVGGTLIPLWNNPGINPLNATPAVKSITVSRAKPPLQPGATATVEIDRALLDSIYPNGAWLDYIKPWCPIEISVRWKYDNGSYDPWTRLIKGYVVKPPKGTTGVNTGTMSLQISDPIIRLKRPAAVIDYRYHPADWLLVFKQADNTAARPNELLPSDVAAYILRTALSDTEAARLQVIDSHELPILSYDMDFGGTIALSNIARGSKPMTSDSVMLPPPFDDDAIGWITQIVGPARRVFYYDTYGDGTSDWPVPIIGRIVDILNQRNVARTVYDAQMVSGRDLLMQAAQTDTHPDQDINRVLVLACTPFDNQMKDFIPALSWGEAVLPDGDPNSRNETFERTLTVRNELAWLGGDGKAIAQAQAEMIIDMITNVNPVWPVIKCRGDGAVSWGDIVTPYNWVDTTLGINGQQFRVEKVDHAIDLWNPGPDSWQTTISVRPRLAGGF